MTQTKKNEIVDSIMALLIQLTESEEEIPAKTRPVEMVTIKECTELIHGLSEHTVRQLVAQGKLKYMRTGQGKRGKILINKKELMDYFA